MQVIIVDDEPAARRTLRECCAGESDLQIVGEYGDGRRALEAIKAQPPDLLFLDIQIEAVNGISLARSLNPQTLPIIVFVTAYDQYALEAFEVSATDYLLKPFDEQRFRQMMARVRRRRGGEASSDRQAALSGLLTQLERNVRALATAAPRILAESGNRMHLLDVCNVEMVEGDRNYVKLSVGGDVFHARSTMEQAEQSLQSQPMLRISRSCLVNVNHVRELSRTPRGDFNFVLACGAKVASSDGYRVPIREYLKRLKISPP
jgi:two-component system, LytTR family, response regulator